MIEHAVIPDDNEAIEKAIKQVGAKLLIIDPLMCFVKHDANKEQAMRQALMPLRDLAEQFNIAVVMVRHLNKSGGRNALYRGTGTIGITAAIRSGFLVAPSPKDPHMRVLCQWKSNLGPTSPSLLFEPVATVGAEPIAGNRHLPRMGRDRPSRGTKPQSRGCGEGG